jgi:hypothetical protein
LLGLAAPARAEPTAAVESPPALSLSWRSDAEGCEGEEPVTREVERLMRGRPVLVSVRAVAEVTRLEGRWHVQLQTTSSAHSGQRSLTGDSCAEVRRAIALLLAMTLEAESAHLTESAPAGDASPPEPAPPEPPGPGSSAPAPATVRGPEPASAPADAGARPAVDDEPAAFGWQARAQGVAATGLVPGVGIGVGASVGAWVGPLDLTIEATHWLPRTTAILDGQGRLEVSAQTLELAACWALWSSGPLTVAPCLAPKLTWLHREATGLGAAPVETPGPLPGLGAEIEIRLSPGGSEWYVALRQGVSWDRAQPFHSCTPSTADCEERLTVYESQSLAPRLRAGVGTRF